MGVAVAKLVPKEEREERTWLPETLRRQVLERDAYHCQLCPKDDDLQVCLQIPRCRGGQTLLWNLVTLCRKCARSKNQMTMVEFVTTSYFRFEVLGLASILEKRSFQVTVHLSGGEVLEGVSHGDPGDSQGDVILYPEKGGKLVINRRGINFLEVSPTFSDVPAYLQKISS